MTDADPQIHVADAPERSRFEITVDGDLAGVCVYEFDAGVLVLAHTEVYEGYAGQGLGGILVRAALDTARARELRVRPDCPYVAAYIERHPDYGDLVA